MNATFQTSTSGKWILLGEHAVIRNHPALVFPLSSRALVLKAAHRRAGGAHAPLPPQSLLTDATLRALRGAQRFIQGRGRAFDLPECDFTVESDIPLSAGLGSSAALCVALGRFLIQEGVLRASELFDACRVMEDEFHGKSSGMDLAVVIRGRPLLFRRDVEPREIVPTWQPHFYLADSGVRSSTSASVKQVETLKERDPAVFAALDARMAVAVEEAAGALVSQASDRLERLIGAIERGATCFDAWGLVPPAMRARMDELMRRGALAVKPTGSGGGGYILSLWPEPAPAELGLLSAFGSTP